MFLISLNNKIVHLDKFHFEKNKWSLLPTLENYFKWECV